MQTILVCDDDKEIVEAIDIYLQQEGYQVLKAYDGEEALEILKEKEVHLLIIDVMMPRLDGIRATLKIREESSIPIIILSAKTEDADKILGLNIGADDYVVKPFEPKELIARIRAVLRRSADSVDEKADEDELSFDGLKINQSTYEVYIDDKKVEMPPKEFELLYFLAKNTNKVFTRDQLLDEIWGYEFFGDSRTVDVHIKRIREKLEGENRTWALKTVWGVGYKFEVS